jgi:hypothetical protein
MVRAMIMLWGGYRGFHQIMIGESKAIFLLDGVANSQRNLES